MTVPQDTVLGDLAITEELVYFDGPQVMICAVASGTTYIAGWADETPDESIWLYVRVSRERLAMVKSGGMPLRDAILNPEDSYVFHVVLPRSGHAAGQDTATPMLPRNLDESWLPEADFRLQMRVETQERAVSGSVLQARARSEHRTRLRLEVALPEMTRSEAPTRLVGDLLLLTQNVLDNVGLALAETDPPQQGRIPANIAAQTASDVLETKAASFVLELGAAQGDDLFGESLFVYATQRILLLLSSQADWETLSHELAELRPRAAKSFRRFVEGLASTSGDVRVGAAGTSFDYRDLHLTSDKLTDFVSTLNRLAPDSTVEEVRGRMRLYRADLDRQVFGVHDEVLDLRYEGKVDDAAYPQLSHATLDQHYDVVIRATTVLDEVVGVTTTTHVLAQLTASIDGA